MKKILLTLLVSLLMAVNIAVGEAAQVSIYEHSAKNLFEKLQEKINNAADEDFHYMIRNFNKYKDTSTEDLKVAGFCDVYDMNSGSTIGKIIFRTDKKREVFDMIIGGKFKNNSDERENILKMTLFASFMTIHSCGLEDLELEILMESFRNNPKAGEWGVWSGDKYFKLEMGKDEDTIIAHIAAYDEE